MKKVVLGTVIAAAALFTGCEDVKEVTSCDLKGKVLGRDVHVCVWNLRMMLILGRLVQANILDFWVRLPYLLLLLVLVARGRLRKSVTRSKMV